MKKHLAAACVAALLTSSLASAQQPGGSRGPATAAKPAPATGEAMRCLATDAEPAPTQASTDTIAEPEAGLAGLDGLEGRIARLERMVATETPVCTMKTSDGFVRVYRDGTVVTDSAGNRSFEQPESPARPHHSHRTPRPGAPSRRSAP